MRARLREDFLGKCYLCEGRLGRAFEVEHRHPRSMGGGEHDWHNLFPAHHDCNNGRPAYPPDGLLSPGDGVEQRLRQWLDDDHLPCFDHVYGADVRATNTARELDHLHRCDTDAADELRRAIQHQFAHVMELLNRLLVRQLEGRDDEEDTQRLRFELRRQLSRGAPYSTLIRSRIDARLLQGLD